MYKAVAVVVCIAFSGCITELLGEEPVTTRTVTCAIIGTESLTIHVHHAGELPIRQAVDAWAAEVRTLSDRTDVRFETTYREPPTDLDAWADSLDVFGKGVTVHVLVLPELESNLAVEVLSPGVVVLSRAQLEGNLNATTGALFHGLGHVLGLVNAGTPIANQNLTGRESPPHHEPKGVMDEGWHRAPFPATETDRYSEALRQDLSALKGVCS